jgi:nucleoside-diphosphate kinase
MATPPKVSFYLHMADQLTAWQSLLEEHYKDLSSKSFFPRLVEYSKSQLVRGKQGNPADGHVVMSGPVVCMVWEGLDAVKTGRVMLGATNPLASNPGRLKVVCIGQC